MRRGMVIVPRCRASLRWISDRHSFEELESVVKNRRSCRQFTDTPVSAEVLDRLLTATIQSPTGFNLQGWTSVVVRSVAQRELLAKACLSQPPVLNAPVTVVFAGDTTPTKNAGVVLEASLECGHTPVNSGSAFLRNVHYMLHSGPMNVMNCQKGLISRWYSHATGEPLLTVPTSMEAYAWKQAMIPLTTFVLLAEAAGLGTCILEGLDEAQVRDVVGLPDRFTVPAVVALGYPAPSGFSKVLSPRLPAKHFIHVDRYQSPCPESKDCPSRPS